MTAPPIGPIAQNVSSAGAEFRARVDQITPKSATPITSADNLWSRLVGLSLERDAWIDGQSRARQLREQSDALARRLEGMGITARQECDATVTIGLCTRSHEAVTGYRNSNLIPVMQSRNVHDMLRHVKHYADKVPLNQLRMWVVSWGWVPLHDYRWNHKQFGRRLSRMAAEQELKDAGVEIVYFSIEDTVQRASGVAMLNLHAHLIVRSSRRLGRKRWPELLNWCRARFPKGYVHDSKFKNAAECVKYCFKWNEISDLSDVELASLFDQTRKLKFYHPLGPIKKFRKELNDRRLKLGKVPGKGKTWNWCLVEKAERVRSNKEPEPDQPNQIMGVTQPSPKFSPRFEPCVIVRNFTGDVGDVMRIPRVRKMADAAWEIWQARLELDQPCQVLNSEVQCPTAINHGEHSREAAGAAGSMEHTTTTTVREIDEDFEPTGLPPPDDRYVTMAKWGIATFDTPKNGFTPLNWRAAW